MPADFYRRSPRRYEGARPACCPAQFAQRRVRPGGEIRWQGRRRFVGESFEGYTVGLRASAQGVWRVYFYEMLVGETARRGCHGPAFGPLPASAAVSGRERPRLREAKFLRRSLMPEGLLDTMTPEQVSDFFAYLKTLK